MFLPIGDDVEKRSFAAVGMILIAVCLVVFLYQNRLWNEANSPKPLQSIEQLKRTDFYKFNHRWGATPTNVAKGHVMCVFTYMFLHGDFIHLLGNMVVFWAFAWTLENALGPGRFLTLYLIWGVAGGIAHVAMNWGRDIPLVGASGAIAGMIGAYFITFGTLTKIRVLLFIGPPMKLDVPAGFFVFVWVLMQIWGLESDQKYGMSNVAWYCHFGGFGAGVATMFCINHTIKGRLRRDWYGKLIIDEEKEEEAKPAAATMLADGTSAPLPEEPPPAGPSACPSCGAELTDKHKIHDKLYRCANPGCQKLVYHQ